ncbi:MAG: phosphoglucomutase/phosphomannomutase family protein [Elusimicrobia bacterium]|jgi:phosphoglucomutase|nr:phosphoglucomutase/phosphomannomutase family protein [Elusimicrobiota bacterium]
MAKETISFGTAGWRGVISRDFTFSNLRIVAQAISDYLHSNCDRPRVITGYDTRFMSEKFAAVASEVFAANNIQVFYSKEDIPTPAISYIIRRQNLSGGINITASHNPPEYSGIKFSPSSGGPALPETTGIIEENCRRIQKNTSLVKNMDFKKAVESGQIIIKDFSDSYIDRISEMIDTRLIQKNLNIAYDPMYGTGRTYLKRILKGADINSIHDYRDVLFGGNRPEPSDELLDELKGILAGGNFDIGLATDGDGDRFGIVDSGGKFINPNQVLGLAFYHLYNKGYRGVGVRSVMTSSFMDAVAADCGTDVVETPVGFKYIGDVFEKQDIIVGGEESGGLTIGGHLPEKDGILACLLMAELRAKEGKPLSDILNRLYKKVGVFITDRRNFSLTLEKTDKLKKELKNSCPDKVGNYEVREINDIDGYKFIFKEKNSWLGLRFSGTEPVVRLYAESTSQEKVNGIIAAAQKLFIER